MDRLNWVDLGLIDYSKAWGLQLNLHRLRTEGNIGDVLLLCEHHPVITVGRRKESANNIHQADVPVFEVERGGDVTYHAPGQLVVYPIMTLADKEFSPTSYLRFLEDIIILICAQFGLKTKKIDGITGVWTDDEQRKIASLGISVRQGVTFHGFALNAHVDLTGFNKISPCGLSASVMTSLLEEHSLYQAKDINWLKSLVVEILGEQLGKNVCQIKLEGV